jgi:hypothetical protein
VYVPAKMYTYCVVESTGSAEIAAVIFAKLAQDPLGPTTSAVDGMVADKTHVLDGKVDVFELVALDEDDISVFEELPVLELTAME